MHYGPRGAGITVGSAHRVPLANWRHGLALAAILSFLVLLLSVAQDYLHLAGTISTSAKIWLLDIDTEQSVFTWISVLSLFFAAQLLLELGQDAFARNDRFKRHWLFLAGVFFFLSFDEFSSIHEKISAAIAGQVDNTGIFYYAWAAPAGLLALVGLAIFIPFIRSFRPRHAVLLVASAVIFLFGAVVMEMVGGAIAEDKGLETAAYRLATSIEEGCELAGVLLFIYVLLDYREYKKKHEQVVGAVGEVVSN